MEVASCVILKLEMEATGVLSEDDIIISPQISTWSLQDRQIQTHMHFKNHGT